MDTDGGIGDTRPARDHADAGGSGQFAPSRGHEGRTALVAAEREIEFSCRIVQGVKDGKIAFPRDAEGTGRTKADKGLNQKLTTVAHRAFLSGE
jgi:hypothetical protein